MASYWSRVQPCKSMARLGQALTQAPQPAQLAGVTTACCIVLPFTDTVCKVIASS